ncbi:MAG: metallothionein [Pseudomonadota bacterium]|nr:metallothionein [Pseudomonadota bacterium]
MNGSDERVKCACGGGCNCEVAKKDAVEKNGKYYCCDACAGNHPGGKGCQHSGCGCSG